MQYEDGDEEWLDLAAERYQWVDRSQQAQQGKAKQAAKRQGGGGGKAAAKGGAAGRVGAPEGMRVDFAALRCLAVHVALCGMHLPW